MNKKALIKFYKRMFFMFLFLIPLYFGIDSLLGEDTSNATKIFVFVLVGLLLIGMVEWIRYKRMQKQR